MLISYHWLKQFVGIKASPSKLAEKITLNLIEVDTITQKGEDTILEVENKGITNRADCFSQLGFAREAAAFFNVKLNDPLERLAKLKFRPTCKLLLAVKVKEPKLCYRYSSIVLTNVKVGPSPKWLRVGVENCGVRSINNVVDVTNYVMLELGQPMHAFDYDLLSGKEIIVRLAKRGEKIITLDDQLRTLNPEILVIADAQAPIAIAGIVGGKKAEISHKTQTIVLESANFDKTNNRRSEKSLKLRTEASTRFEKGLDINLTLPALNRAVELLKKVAGAQVASQTIDKKYKNLEPWQVRVSPQWINKFLGLKLTTEEMIKILNRLQLKSKLKNGQLAVTIPTFRTDLTMPADIAEEIARIYGFDNIPITPLAMPLTLPEPNIMVQLRKKTKLFLKGTGFSEILNPPFLGKETLKLFFFNPKNHLRLINPLTVDQEYLRRSLLPRLIMAIKENLRFFNKLKFFEIGRIFIPQGEKQPKEIEKLAAVMIGPKSYLNLKGVAENLFDSLGIKINLEPLKENLSFWQAEQTAEIVSREGKKLGKIGKIKQPILEKLEINKNLSALEVNFGAIVKMAKLAKIYKPISRYPPIIEDLTFIIKPKTYVQNLIQLIKECSLLHRLPGESRRPSKARVAQPRRKPLKGVSLIQSVSLIDSYKNSRTFRITYQHPERNLTDIEVKKIREKIIKKVEERLQVKLKA